MPDKTMRKILEVILDIGRYSPTRAMYVCAFLIDYLQTMQELGERFGKSRQNAHEHLTAAGRLHPEIRELLKSRYRANVVRQRGNKRRKK